MSARPALQWGMGSPPNRAAAEKDEKEGEGMRGMRGMSHREGWVNEGKGQALRASETEKALQPARGGNGQVGATWRPRQVPTRAALW